jgi:hypothetical protein
MGKILRNVIVPEDFSVFEDLSTVQESAEYII